MRADDQQPAITSAVSRVSAKPATNRRSSVFVRTTVLSSTALLAAACYMAFDFGTLRSEITSYSGTCAVDVVEVGRCSRIVALREQETFRVWPDRQIVVWRSGAAVHRRDCIVFDRRHWRCDGEDGDMIFAANGLIYRSTSNPHLQLVEARRVDLSRWRYLALKWMGCGGEASDSRRCAWLAPG
jgi:hypothetical protein